MRPAEFEGFFYLCPANKDDDGWHHRYGYNKDIPAPCAKCGQQVKCDNYLNRWVLAEIPFLLIEEEPI